MHASEIAGVAGIATPIRLWRCFQYDDTRACFCSRDRCTKGCVAATNDGDIPIFNLCHKQSFQVS
jgi:hypothetical protein